MNENIKIVGSFITIFKLAQLTAKNILISRLIKKYFLMPVRLIY